MPPVRQAPTAPNARGFGLHQLLAGRRTGGPDAAPMQPVEVCKATGWKAGGPYPPECLTPATLTRVLRGERISEMNLKRIARGLGVDLEEVRRAYTVTVREADKAKREAADGR